MIQRYYNNLSLFVKEVLGNDLWWIQEGILDSLSSHKYVNVASANATGKSFIAARAALAYLCTQPNSKVAVAAPTVRQLNQVVLKEISSAYIYANKPLFDKGLVNGEIEITPGWSLFGFVPEFTESLSGIYSDNTLVVLDEVPAMKQDFILWLKEVSKHCHMKILTLGTPIPDREEFYNLFSNPEPGSRQFYVSAFDTPNFTFSGVDEQTLKNGEWSKVSYPFSKLIKPEVAYDLYSKYGDNNFVWKNRIMGQFV